MVHSLVDNVAVWFTSNYIPTMGWEVFLCDQIGLKLTTMRYLLSLICGLVVGAGMFYLRGRQARLIYSFLTGLLLVYYPFGNEIFLAMPPILLTYAAMVFAPKSCGQMAWAINFPYLMAWHMINASGHAWQQGDIDFTGGQMVVTLKIIAIAISRADGVADSSKTLTVYAQSKRLDRVPSLLEYFSYTFAYGNLLAGPFFEYKDFLNFISREGDWSEEKDKPKIKFPVYKTLYYVASALAIFAINQLLEPTYNLGSWKEIDRLPYLQRYLLVYIVLITYRLRYYFVWTLAELSLIMSGLGFQGYEKDQAGQMVPKWDRCNQAQLFKVELCDSCARVPQHWNIATGTFLRRYVYERQTGTPFMNMMVTQIVSGVWHGLFPGQIMFFCFSAILFQASKVIYRFEKALLPGWAAQSIPWTVLKIIFTSWALNSTATSFVMVGFDSSLYIWREMNYAAHIACLILTLLGPLIPNYKKKPKNGSNGVVEVKPHSQ
eukprot:TRINITY_DN3141_c0_g1_i2.p1 TRINITY_DN3141_c0_g1~~TRINITY_DN3141_c0_g1_i2.p1  ORF type:complete len:490 (+),score=42.82 TRINITY_DN3141_c0_g1_i2:298-1767(+)